MVNALLSCSVCKQLFRSTTALRNHVRRQHQTSVKVKYRNGLVREIRRGDDDAFKCGCGKTLKHPLSLHKHVKQCNDELTTPDEVIEQDMSPEENYSDASESAESDDNVASDTESHCFGMNN